MKRRPLVSYTAQLRIGDDICFSLAASRKQLYLIDLYIESNQIELCGKPHFVKPCQQIPSTDKKTRGNRPGFLSEYFYRLLSTLAND
ncbi:uncharacterized protein Dvar_11590 [Desulfosarcina variabilis str. Montpellier]